MVYLLNIMIVKLIHIISSSSSWFISIALYSITFVIIFTHLDSVQVLAIMNNAAINIFVVIF